MMRSLSFSSLHPLAKRACFPYLISRGTEMSSRSSETQYTGFQIYVPRWDQAKIDHKAKMTLFPE